MSVRVGPKKVKLFYEKLSIESLDQLKKAAATGQLRDLPKMGEKSEAEILKSIEEYEQMPRERRLLRDALAEAEKILAYLRECPDIVQLQYAGSMRRGAETIGDIDILCSGKHGSSKGKKQEDEVARIMDYYAQYREISSVINRGETKSSVLLKSGMQVDLRVLDARIFGAALHYFTGSKNHNIRVRDLAKRKGLKVSEYGVFEIIGTGDDAQEKLIAGKTEEEVFRSVGLPFIIPEMREDRGEIEYGLEHDAMPEVVAYEDLRGDLHSHSKWSDGSQDIETIAKAYRDAGFSYMAMTDHSKLVGVTGGLDDAKAIQQWAEIDRVNGVMKGAKGASGTFHIFKGSEVDILKDGRLDFSEEILKKLEVVCASTHLYHDLPEADQTSRIIRAIESGFVKILSHPSGRLINQRKPIVFNYEAVFQACADHHVAVEINGSPERMDASDSQARLAKSLGCKFAINSDSHRPAHLANLKYGVTIARRAWLSKEDIINTMTLEELMKYWGLS
jgi:DNA polymerase (family 10)